eukprot:gene7851-9362_t
MSRRNLELGTSAEAPLVAKDCVSSCASPEKCLRGGQRMLKKYIEHLREAEKETWFLYFLYTAFAAMVIGMVVIDCYTSRTAPLLSISGTSCFANGMNGGNFLYYMQLTNGMCTTEMTYDTHKASDCLTWNNVSFWEDFAAECSSYDNPECKEHAAGQAKNLSVAGLALTNILLVAGIVTGVLKGSQTFYEWFVMGKWSENAGYAYRVTVAVLSLIALFTSFLFSAFPLGYSKPDGTEPPNQIVMKENWQTYYNCDEIDLQFEAGYHQYYMGTFFGAFTTFAALIWACAACCGQKRETASEWLYK